MTTGKQIANDRQSDPEILAKSTSPRIRDRRPLSKIKMNLNKRTHFDEAKKELTPKTAISRPLLNPSQTPKIPFQTHLKADQTHLAI